MTGVDTASLLQVKVLEKPCAGPGREALRWLLAAAAAVADCLTRDLMAAAAAVACVAEKQAADHLCAAGDLEQQGQSWPVICLQARKLRQQLTAGG